LNGSASRVSRPGSVSEWRPLPILKTVPKKRTLSSTFEYQQTYRRPARYTDKVVLGTLGFIFMISDLAQAPPSQVLHVPLVLAGVGSYIVATIAGRALRAVAKRQKLYSATRRASTRWTPATREHWLTATAIGNAAAIGLSAWFVALTVNAGFPALQSVASAAAAFTAFVTLPGYWELAKLTEPRETPGR